MKQVHDETLSSQYGRAIQVFFFVPQPLSFPESWLLSVADSVNEEQENVRCRKDLRPEADKLRSRMNLQ